MFFKIFKKDKLNCWEYKKCGREPGGSKVEELGVCPTCTETELDGVHEGENAGRSCWVVAGTFCTGEVEGSFAQKINDCTECDFFIKVKSEETRRQHHNSKILSKYLLNQKH